MNAVTNAITTITTHYIDGVFVESHGREIMDIVRPTDSQVIARVTLADEKDARRAIASFWREARARFSITSPWKWDGPAARPSP